jgi:PIN domain nuclease of toxin-antitoxin system
VRDSEHRDAFNRVLVAQAVMEGLTLTSKDGE